MKNLGKILALVVAMSMLLGVVAFGATFTDVKDTDSSAEAISVLSSLGLLNGYPDGTFGPEKTITRAEFAAVVDRSKALGDSAEAAKGDTDFTDVKADHWASGYINLAAQQKIVNGMGDGTFAPEKEVTFAQAVKMIVAALGYTPEADSKGGWPTGYLAVAARLNITKGVSGKETQGATRAMVAKMLYNALDVPLMEQTGFGTETKVEAGSKMLLDGLDVVKVSGKVTKTKYSDSTTTLKKEEVTYVIKKAYVADAGSVKQVASGDSDSLYSNAIGSDETTFTVKVGNTNAKDLLQYDTIAYIKNIDDTPVFAAIAPKEGKNDTLTVKGEDVKYSANSITLSGSGVNEFKFTYYTDKDNDKDDDITVESAAVCYYNGSKSSDNSRPYYTTAADAYKLVSYALNGDATRGGKLEGTVTFLNNDDDDNYDVVFVNEAKDFVVDEVNTKTYKITTKSGMANANNPTLKYDIENKDYDFSIVKDGKPAKLEDIKQNDVISVGGYYNSDKEVEYGTTVVTSAAVVGKILEFNEADDEVKIGDKTYKYTSWVYDNQNTKLSTGSEGTYYVNSMGKVCAADSKTISNDQLGKLLFVTKIASNNGISSSVQLRGLTTKGEWKTFDLASKVAINATIAVPNPTMVEPDNTWTTANWRTYYAKAGVDTSDSKTTWIYAIVSYDVNSDGKINKLDFVADVNSANHDDSNFTYESFNAAYDVDNKKLNSKVFVNDSTIVYDIYNGLSYDANGYVNVATSEDDITVNKVDVMMDGETYAGTAYNLNDDDEAAVIVGSGFTGVFDHSKSFMVVDSTAQVQNSDSDTVTKITGYVKGEKVTVVTTNDVTVTAVDNNAANYTETDTTVDTLRKGSIILYTKNVKDEANKVLVLFDAKTVAPTGEIARPTTIKSGIELFTRTSNGDTFKYVLGYAYEKSSSKYTLVPKQNDAKDDLTAKQYTFATTRYVYTFDGYYDSNKGQVKVADTGDIDTDKTVDNAVEGDFVFARVDDSDKIIDAVVIKNNN